MGFYGVERVMEKKDKQVGIESTLNLGVGLCSEMVSGGGGSTVNRKTLILPLHS